MPGLSGKVDTFIGTGTKLQGNTFPGASAPFGMLQVSPIGSTFPGWQQGQDIRGLGRTFLSGAGCWEQGGIVSVLPTVGTVGEGGDFDTRHASSFDHTKYASPIGGAQTGRAGYYRTHLQRYGIDVEATAVTRAAAERYTFPQSGQANVFLNVGQATETHRILACEVTVVGNNAVRGWVRSKSFCSGALEKHYTTWFHTVFDRDFASFGTWDRHGGVESRRSASGTAPNQSGTTGTVGAWVTFGTVDTVSSTTAISKVDAEGALKNWRAEGAVEDGSGPIAFDQMRDSATGVWDEHLGRVTVETDSASDETVFYTALYHSLLAPMTASDADGRYRGFDDGIHTTEGLWDYHEFFSLWDTYRTQNQLVAMVYPRRARQIVRSLLAVNDEGGWLPKWGYANYETNVQTGDAVTCYLADLWRFGAFPDDPELVERLYQAMRRNAFEVPPEASDFSGRAGNPNYLENGYVQYEAPFPEKKGMDADPEYGGSATFEYALADWALAQVAEELGHSADAHDLRARSRNWRTLWNEDVHDTQRGVPFTGFPAARYPSGNFNSAGPTRAVGFQEGTAWQYQWMAQQDPDELVARMGGRTEAARRLDAFFGYSGLIDSQGRIRPPGDLWVQGAISYDGHFEYNPNNESDLHAAWMYAAVAQPWKATTVNRAAQTLYDTTPEGIPGNDDLGAISAWYVLSALGLYPVVPGDGRLFVHAPRFTSATLASDDGGIYLTITADETDPSLAQYVTGLDLDGTTSRRPWIDWERLRITARLDHTLSTTPPAP